MQDHRNHLLTHRARLHREADAAFAQWAAGYGVIQHSPQTQLRIFEMAQLLVAQCRAASPADVYHLLRAADCVASAAMWLTVHMTYAQRVRWDGALCNPTSTSKRLRVIPVGRSTWCLPTPATWRRTR